MVGGIRLERCAEYVRNTRAASSESARPVEVLKGDRRVRTRQSQQHVDLAGQDLQHCRGDRIANVADVQHPHAPHGEEVHRVGIGIPPEFEGQAFAGGKGADRHAAHRYPV